MMEFLTVNFDGVGVGEEKMMAYYPWLSRRIALWTCCAIGTATWCEYTHAISETADDVWFIEGNPVLYTVAENAECDADVSFIVEDNFTREETSITRLKSLWEVPVV
jgi:hypothetical protein